MESNDGRKKLWIDIPRMSSPNPHAREEVYSPMTELSINFQNSCTSHCSTPRRRLSLNTPTKQTLSVAESMESGIDTCVESPCSSNPSGLHYLVDSPSFFPIRPFTRSQSSSSATEMSLRKRLALQSQFSIADAISSHSSQSKARKITVPNLKLLADGCLEDITGGHPELSRSPESEEVAALTYGDTEINISCSETNRSFSAPPVLDSVEKYFTDLENPSPVSCDDGFSEFEEHDYEGNQSQEISSAVAGLISAPLIKRTEDASSEDILEELNSPKTRFEVCGESALEKEADKMALFRPKPNVTFAKPLDLPIKKRSVSFSVKRADPPRDVSPIIRKRLKLRSKSLIGSDQTVRSPLATVSPNLSPGRFGRSLSLDSPRNKAVMQLLGENEANLVGDGSESHCFPTFIGRNEDLKTISCETLKEALEGKYDGTINNLMIVDCRYPYEYKGGHIKDAINIFTKEDLTEEFLRKPKCAGQRLAIVFHCEFSSQRGPSMYRFLRNKDRDIHRHCYPKLHYPELYLLEGGYKEFYLKCKEFCEPQGYQCMHDENYSQELKHFMKRSKSWTEGNCHLRTGLRY